MTVFDKGFGQRHQRIENDPTTGTAHKWSPERHIPLPGIAEKDSVRPSQRTRSSQRESEFAAEESDAKTCQSSDVTRGLQAVTQIIEHGDAKLAQFCSCCTERCGSRAVA